MRSFIILSVMRYERLTRCYILHTDLSEFKELDKTCQATCFFYQLWITGVLLNILPKILDSIDMVRVANEIKSCSVKILSSPVVSWNITLLKNTHTHIKYPNVFYCFFTFENMLLNIWYQTNFFTSTQTHIFITLFK